LTCTAWWTRPQLEEGGGGGCKGAWGVGAGVGWVGVGG
jgi:hypothetical protein